MALIALSCLAPLMIAVLSYGAQIRDFPDDTSVPKLPPGLTIENLELGDNTRRYRSTPKPPPIVTTSKPPIAPSDSDGVLYRLDNKEGRACILIYCDAIVQIDFVTKLKEKVEADVYVPSDVSRSGECGEDEAKFTMAWKNYAWSIYFSKTPGGDHWYVGKMEVDANTSDKRLEHINRQESVLHFSTSRETGMLFPTPVGKAYSCNDEITVNLNDGDITAEILLRRLKMQPFIFKKDDFGPEHVCSPGGQKSYRSETAPVAVGSTFAVITILTVTGYGVYRYMKIKKVQYDTME